MKIAKDEYEGKTLYTDEFKTSVAFLRSIMGVATDELARAYGVSDSSVKNWTKKYPVQFLEENLSEKSRLITVRLEKVSGACFSAVYEDERQVILFCPEDRDAVKKFLEEAGFKAASLKKVDFTDVEGTFITLSKNSRFVKNFLLLAEDEDAPLHKEAPDEKEGGSFDAADEICEETELDGESSEQLNKATEECSNHEECCDHEECCEPENFAADSHSETFTDEKPVVPAGAGMEKIRKIMILRAVLLKNKLRPFKNNIDIGGTGFSFMVKKGLLNFRLTTEKIYRALSEAGFDEAEVALRCVWEHKKYFFSVYIPEYCKAFGGKSEPLHLSENPWAVSYSY